MKSQPRSTALTVYGLATALVWLALALGAARADAPALRAGATAGAVASR